MSATPAGGSATGLSGSPISRSTRRTFSIFCGADERAGDLVDGLGRGAQRNDEEGCVPVERDQVADVDLPGEREARAEPGHEDDEEARG